MRAMWERRLLSALIAVVGAGAVAPFEPEGFAFYALVSAVTFIALLGGGFGAEWLQARRHRAQG